MSTTRKYGSPSGDPNLGRESARDLGALDDHIEKWWGKAPEVFHEIVSEYVHIDLTIVPATPERPYHSVITTGMSDRPMNPPNPGPGHSYCELVLALPPEWPTKQEAFSDEKVWWPLRRLKMAARFPHIYSTWLWYAHTLADEGPAKPFADDVGFSASIISMPVLVPSDALSVKIRDDKTVNFFSYVPIYESELLYAREHGSDALFEKLDEAAATELIQKDRPRVV